MEVADLNFQYPSELIATEPRRPSRVLLSHPGFSPEEISIAKLLSQIPAGDVLVVNDTKVIPTRVWSKAGDEVLFIRDLFDEARGEEWEVLFKARDYKLGQRIEFPGDLEAELTQKSLPQRLKVHGSIDHAYFEKFGEPALPPYIQVARDERHSRKEDLGWYQTKWAEHAGSIAAPTASLHFSKKDLADLEARGVKVCKLTLHVGPGTFLPIKVQTLTEHHMHSELVNIPRETLNAIQNRQVWALGTTATRALESWAAGQLEETEFGFSGPTNLFIHRPEQFKVVNHLLTNFHQPQSTLLALVMAFAGIERVKTAYEFAVKNQFRLFSYGDLSVWTK
jgi:S-adenosylmethionine:tRNA ribosyltransferase-isomerase